MQTKLCSKCGRERLLSEFNKASYVKSGLRADCRGCERKAGIARRRAKGIKPKSTGPTVRDKKYRQEERRRAYAKQGKIYRTREEKVRLNALIKEERKALKRIARKVKGYQAGITKEMEGMSDAERYRYRYRNNPDFNIKERLRRQINKQKKKDKYADLMRAAINRDGSSPTVSKLFGYTISELKQHLESQFKDGMSWDAFMSGEIHIDHIKPISAHDLTKHEELVACWSLSNLQPLWAKDNLIKSNKWDEAA